MSTIARYLLYVLAGVVVLIVAGLALWQWDPFHRRHNAEVKAATATVTAKQAEGTTHIIEKYHDTLQPIIVKGAAGERIVEQLPGAQTPLTPERRAALCGILGGLRDGADPCAPQNTGESAQALR